MSDTKKNLDEASTGGGTGDIPAQPYEDAAPSIDPNDPVTDGMGDNGHVEGQGLSVDGDADASGEDPDDTADETLGVTP